MVGREQGDAIHYAGDAEKKDTKGYTNTYVTRRDDAERQTMEKKSRGTTILTTKQRTFIYSIFSDRATNLYRFYYIESSTLAPQHLMCCFALSPSSPHLSLNHTSFSLAVFPIYISFPPTTFTCIFIPICPILLAFTNKLKSLDASDSRNPKSRYYYYNDIYIDFSLSSCCIHT